MPIILGVFCHEKSFHAGWTYDRSCDSWDIGCDSFTYCSGGDYQAREAAARNIVKTLRNQIELYKFNHNDLAPGYANGGITAPESIVNQFIYCSKLDGSPSPFKTPTGDYIYGPYLPEMAVNPYNNLYTIAIVAEATEFSAAADDSTGWLYKRETAEIRINSTGTGMDGVKYYDY